MQPEIYYQTNTEKATPLVLLTKEQWLTSEKDLNPFERNCLISQKFEGCLGNIGVISDVEGKLSKVYVGAGDKLSDAIAMAHATIFLPAGSYASQQPLSSRALLVWALAQYRFDKYKANLLEPRILAVQESELKSVLIDAAAVFLVRDLINTPSSDLGPEQLAKAMATIAEQHGADFQQWVGDELLQENFPAIHTVGRASSAAPRLLSLTWGKEEHPRVCLVGKGVCFDAGGLNIKPATAMRYMKKDMGGAAHVLGLAQWVMMHNMPIRLHVLVPAVENLVDADSYRPGDILTTRNGLKVEVHDTDAEGRLVLADALVKACEYKPELLIDFATLTGAARVAVGPDIAALFTNDDKLATELTQSAQEVSDPIWRLPLFEGYSDYLLSTIADCTNACSIPYAGAITAALFLQRFISKDVTWAHFDIMAWNIINKPGRPEGGEAMGLLAVGDFLRRKYG